MAKPGMLFPNQRKTDFLGMTRQQYDNMKKRIAKKKLPPLNFTLDDYRAHVLRAFGGAEDGAIQCRYCRAWFSLSETAVDHAMPLGRGGSSGLDNLEFPCRADNDGKGQLTPEEYDKLLNFLLFEIPLGRSDVLSRLRRANALAAGAVRSRMFMNAAKEQGFTMSKKPKPIDSKPF